MRDDTTARIESSRSRTTTSPRRDGGGEAGAAAGSPAHRRERSRRSVLRWLGAGAVTGTGFFAGVGAGADPESGGGSKPAFPNTVTIDGRAYDGATTYSFVVSGAVRTTTNGDSTDGSTARGLVYGWMDEYEFDGEITSLTLDGPADVYVNDQQVDPTAFDEPASGDSGDSGEMSVVEAVATGGSDDSLVETVEVQRAINWWSTGSAVPGTGGETIPTQQIQQLINLWSTGTPVDTDDGSPPALRKLGQTMLSGRSNGAGYAEAQLRADGQYAVVGTKFGAHGTYLVDLADPADPEEVHYAPGTAGIPNPDVKFDHRDGLYYRTVQGPGNFDVVDYGYAAGTPSSPVVAAAVDGSATHNLWAHPEAAVLYTVNYDGDPSTGGFDVWDVSDPTAPRELRTVGPSGACHDVTVDTQRDLLHVCYQGYDFEGYVVFDASDPRRPRELGRFDYDRHGEYSAVGEEGFESAHHAEADPNRDLVVLGDEISYGIPGGKHVFDIGWGDGSPSDPRPVGFVTSPNAERMNDGTERWDWTGHHFDFVPWDDRTFLVSGDWHEGVVLYDVTDPTAPRAVDRYATDDDADRVSPNPTLGKYGDPPWCWNAEYDPERNLVVAGDQFTGLYTFDL